MMATWALGIAMYCIVAVAFGGDAAGLWELSSDLAKEDLTASVMCVGGVIVLFQAIPDTRPRCIPPPAWVACKAVAWGAMLLLASIAYTILTDAPVLVFMGGFAAFSAILLAAGQLARRSASAAVRDEEEAGACPEPPRPTARPRPSRIKRLCLSGGISCTAAAFLGVCVLVDAGMVTEYFVCMAGTFAAMAVYAPLEDAVEDGLVPYRLGARLYAVHCVSAGVATASVSALAGLPASDCICMGVGIALCPLLVPAASARRDGRAALFDMDGNRRRRRRRRGR